MASEKRRDKELEGKGGYSKGDWGGHRAGGTTHWGGGGRACLRADRSEQEVCRRRGRQGQRGDSREGAGGRGGRYKHQWKDRERRVGAGGRADQGGAGRGSRVRRALEPGKGGKAGQEGKEKDQGGQWVEGEGGGARNEQSRRREEGDYGLRYEAIRVVGYNSVA
ncbi:hypothetical protein Tco_0775347 [Tanacetum coccineum]